MWIFSAPLCSVVFVLFHIKKIILYYTNYFVYPAAFAHKLVYFYPVFVMLIYVMHTFVL